MARAAVARKRHALKIRSGDQVRVIESRPLSRTKRWSLVDVVERAR